MTTKTDRPAATTKLRPLPRLAADAHKGDAGRVLCVCGSRTMPGAAILAARAAQRAGAGLVAVGCLDRELFTVLPGAVPEAVLVDLSAGEGHAGLALESRRPHARLVGPGIGDDARARELVRAALALEDGAPLLLDADALNALDGAPEALRLRASRSPVVITPHPGEAERLAGEPAPRDEAGRVAFASRLAERSGAIVCLKGAGTVVTDGERRWVNPTGNPGMATAGAGDVLAGILVAYLARTADAGERFTPFDAAAAAVWVHGSAGDHAARELGERAVIASDLVAALSFAQRRFEEGREQDA